MYAVQAAAAPSRRHRRLDRALLGPLVDDNRRKRCVEGERDQGEVRDGMDNFANLVRDRMKRRRHERSEGDQAEQYAGNNVDPADGPTEGGVLGTNPLDDPEGDVEDEPTEEGVSMTNPL